MLFVVSRVKAPFTFSKYSSRLCDNKTVIIWHICQAWEFSGFFRISGFFRAQKILKSIQIMFSHFKQKCYKNCTGFLWKAYSQAWYVHVQVIIEFSKYSSWLCDNKTVIIWHICTCTSYCRIIWQIEGVKTKTIQRSLSLFFREKEEESIDDTTGKILCRN